MIATKSKVKVLVLNFISNNPIKINSNIIITFCLELIFKVDKYYNWIAIYYLN